MESESHDLQYQFLQRISSLELNAGEDYSADTFEHKVISFAIACLSEESRSSEQENFRSKLFLNTGGHRYAINEIADNDVVQFDKLRIDLKLSKILPSYQQTSGLVEELISQFVSLKDKSELRKKIFGVGRAKNKSDIYDELKTHYAVIENAEQLAFLLLYAKQSSSDLEDPLTPLKGFQVNTKSGAKTLVDGPFYLNSYQFICDDRILAGYKDLGTLLDLNEEKQQFKMKDCVVLCLEPLFIDSTFYCPGIRPDLADSELLQQFFWEYIYERWSVLQPSSIHIKGEVKGTGLNTQENVLTNVEQYLNFEPSSKILEVEYALDSERDSELPPNWMVQWSRSGNLEQKLAFLRTLGINTTDSHVVNLRKFFKGQLTLDTNRIVEQFSTQKKLALNTLRWCASKAIEFNSETKLSAVKEILRLIQTGLQSESPIPIVLEGENNTISHRLEYASKNPILFSLSKVSEQAKKLYFQIDIARIVKSLISSGHQLIAQDVLPDTWNIDQLHISELRRTLNVDAIKKTGTELKEGFYQRWKEIQNNRYSIFLCPAGIPYQVIIEDSIITRITQVEIEADIDKESGIIAVKTDSSEDVIKKLATIINKGNFTKEILDQLEDKKRGEADDIKTYYREIYTPPADGELERIQKGNENKYFPKGEKEDFIEKLVSLLDSQESPWKGYIYHFAHIEAAASIIKSEKIMSRLKVKNLHPKEFKDSAGQVLIDRTDSFILDCARFYFRPLTPTQYHNEGLGAGIFDDNPICPVPVFFVFPLRTVLTKYPNDSYVSNGNLSTGWAEYGKTYDFLKKFDFENVYKKYGETDLQAYKRASQQELIVQEELDFSDIPIKVICRSNQDREMLIKLIPPNSSYRDLIKVDRSYYNNRNPYIIVEQSKHHINANVAGRYVSGKLVIKAKYTSQSELDGSAIIEPFINVAAANQLEAKLPTPSKYSIHYQYNSKEWLIFSGQFSNSELDPKSFLNLLRHVLLEEVLDTKKLVHTIKLLPGLSKLFGMNSSTNGLYNLERHTLLVLSEFEKYFSKEWRKISSVRKLFRLLLCVHDIGKPEALQSGNKDHQFENTISYLVQLREYFPLSKRQFKIMLSMLEKDPIGRFFQGEISVETASFQIYEMALNAGIIQQSMFFNYFKLFTIFYQVDAGSYTVDAGGQRYLEQLFQYVDSSQKCYHPAKNRLLFSNSYEEKYSQLEREFISYIMDLKGNHQKNEY